MYKNRYKVCIVHGRGTNEKSSWIPYVKKELEKRDDVLVYTPRIGKVPVINDIPQIIYDMIGYPDEKTFFVGHSNGNLALTVYFNWISQVYSDKLRFAGTYMVAPFHKVNKKAVEEITNEKTNILPFPFNKLIFNHYNPIIQDNCEKWNNLPESYWNSIKKMSKKNVCFFSENDPFVDNEQIDFMEDKLSPDINIISNAGHFRTSDGYREFPQLIDIILKDLK